MDITRVIKAHPAASVLFLIAAAATGLSTVAPAHGQEGPDPNIIVIQVDDLDLGSYLTARDAISTDGMEVMWRLHALSTNALTTNFNNSFVSYPLCCPSRATFLTGQYAHNHNVIGNGDRPGQVGGCTALDHDSTLPVWLRTAGPIPYRTGFFGKYLNAYGIEDGVAECQRRYVPPGWTDWEALVGWQDLQGTDHWGNAQSERRYRLTTSIGGNPPTVSAPILDYQTTRLATDAVNLFVNTTLVAPFFLYLAPTAPHRESGHSLMNSGVDTCGDNVDDGIVRPETPTIRSEFMADEGLANLFDLPQPPSFNELDLSDKPAYMDDELRPYGPQSENDCTEQIYQERIESLRSVDRMIGSIAGAITPAPPNGRPTYVFFTSDNGFFLGHHQAQQKELAYEEAIRVPLLVFDPNSQCGNRTLNQLVLNTDLARTIADLAGVDPTGGLVMDGRSLLPLLEPANCGNLQWDRRRFLIEHWEDASEAPWPTFTAIRTSDTQEMYLEAPGVPRSPEYYTLTTDPFQRDGGGGVPCGIRCNILSNLLTNLEGCAGTSCRTWEDIP